MRNSLKLSNHAAYVGIARLGSENNSRAGAPHQFVKHSGVSLGHCGQFENSTVACNDNRKLRDVSDIIWSMAHQFFVKFGTNPGDPPAKVFTNAGYLQAYSKVVVNYAQLGRIKQKGLGAWVVGSGFAPREFPSQLQNYTMNSEYFINEHHGAIFKACCWRLFDWLFMPANGKTDAHKTRVRMEMRMLSVLVPSASEALLESLGQLGVAEDRSGFTLPAAGSCFDPQGRVNFTNFADMVRMGVVF